MRFSGFRACSLKYFWDLQKDAPQVHSICCTLAADPICPSPLYSPVSYLVLLAYQVSGTSSSTNKRKVEEPKATKSKKGKILTKAAPSKGKK